MTKANKSGKMLRGVVLTSDEADEIFEEFRLLIEAMDEYNYKCGDYFYTDNAHKQLNVLRKRIEDLENDEKVKKFFHGLIDSFFEEPNNHVESKE